VIENVPGRLSELLLGGTLDIALMAQPTPFDARLNVAPLSAWPSRLVIALSNAIRCT
jgi:hypothetical protein